MKHIVNVKNLKNVNTGDFGVVPADTGIGLAKKGAAAICNGALNDPANWTITPVLGCAPATAAGCCATLAAVADATVIFTADKSGAGFLLTKLVGDAKFSVAPNGTGVLLGVNSKTNAGNALGQDLLPNFLVQLLPNGTNGVVIFQIFHALGGANPRTFSITTSAYATLTDQADAITAGFNAAGLGLTAATRIGKLNAELVTLNPQEFLNAPITHVTNANIVTEIQVTPVGGQIVLEENNSGPASVPALSPWGVFALVMTLLLASLWFLRRRTRMAQA